MQTITTLSARSRITSGSNSFQQKGLLDQDLRNRARLQSALADRGIFLGVVGDPTATAPRVKAGRMMRGKLPMAAPFSLQGRAMPGKL